MALRTWFRPQATCLNRTRKPRAASRLRVETLEDRTTPSGGTLDPTFGTGGIVTVPAANSFNDRVTAVQPDGKILSLVTTPLKNSHFNPAVIRLNTNGTVDTTFGTNGTVNLPVAQNAYGTALAVAPDGKILIGAEAYFKAGNSDVEFAVARLTPAGALDTSFGNSHGWWLSNPTARDDTVLQLATVPAAGGGYSVIVGGTAGATAGQGVGSFAVAKLTSAGLSDPTFGTNGLTVRKVSTGVNQSSPTSMAVTTSGEVVFAGYVGGPGDAIIGRVLVGFTAAGQPDAGFGVGGVVTIAAIGPGGVAAGLFGTFPGTIYPMSGAVVAAQGNSLIVAGTVSVNDPSGTGRVGAGYVIRYNSAGILDSTFGAGGVYYGPASLTTGNSVFDQMAVEADGSIAVVGLSGYNDAHNVNHHGLIVGHLTADGHADPGFGTAGTGLVIRYDQDPSSTVGSLSFGYFSLCIDPNGNLLVGLETLADTAHDLLMRFTVA